MGEGQLSSQPKWAGLVPGRHVFYEDHVPEGEPGTCAAIISRVWPGPDGAPTGLVNLCVINMDGTTRPVTSVSFNDAPEITKGRWRWMFDSQPTALAIKHNL